MPSNAKNLSSASFFGRAAAFAIDITIIFFVFTALPWFLSFLLQDELASAWLSLLSVTLTIAYLTYFTSLDGQTLGKKLLKIQVLDISTGKPPSIFNAFVRETVGKLISAVVFGVGFWIAIFDYRGRTWHDRLSGTIVLKQS